MNVVSKQTVGLFLSCCAFLLLGQHLCLGQQDDEPKAVVDADAEQAWHTSLDEGIKEAIESNKPIFAIVGAEWCVYCKKLEKELADGPIDQLRKQWILVKIDADERVSDARELRATGLPSLRLLTKNGLVAASHDGYMPMDSLTTWLAQNYEGVKSNVPEMLEIDPADFTDQQVAELVKLAAIRDVTIRRIVIERLSKIPRRCVASTIDLLESPGLAKQLSALELLRKWNAPVEGIDPWIPESIDQEVIKQLRQWSRETYPDGSKPNL